MDSNSHAGHRKNLKERFLKDGLSSFQEHEILELALFFTIPRRNTNDIAHDLISKFGSFKNVVAADYQDLLRCDNIGENSALFLKLLDAILIKYRFSDKKIKRIRCINDACNYFVKLLYGEKNEKLFVMCLGTNFEILHVELVAEGSINSAPIYPRKIAQIALKCNSSFIILAHNHPSGTPRPSRQDIDCTLNVLNVLLPLEINLVDHIITHDDEYYSFSAQKLIFSDIPEKAAYTAQYADWRIISSKKEDKNED